MRVWDQEPTACYIQARGRADDFIFLPLVHRNSASKHTADFISAFKKRHLLPFFPANNTTIVMPAGPFPMMATCLFYFLHAFDKACPDMKRRYRSHCWKCVSVRPCCPAHNVSRIVFHGHTPANSPHSKGYFQTAAAPPAPAGRPGYAGQAGRGGCQHTGAAALPLAGLPAAAGAGRRRSGIRSLLKRSSWTFLPSCCGPFGASQ